MALIDNVVHEQSTTTGSGNMTIGALNGRQRFSEAFSTGGSDTFYYSIMNQDAGEWEIGTGSLADANTLVRDTVLASSNSGLAVTFSAGTKDVVNGIPQSDAALLSDLASTSNGFGASLIGIEDSGGLITATTVEGALSEIASDLVTNYQPLDADLTTWANITPGTGVGTALAVNVGTAGSFVVNGGALGTPSSVTLTNATGLPISTGVSGLGTGVATFLATPSSANLASAVTGATGSGALVFGTSPGFTTSANPASDDGATLGTTSLKWSDLFLASGSVINFNSGDVTITHSTNTLTIGGIETLSVSENQAGTLLSSFSNATNGTTAAVELRHVVDIGNGARLLSLNSGYTTSGMFQSGTVVFLSDTSMDGLTLMARKSTGFLRFATGGFADANERMRITGSGNVGIGTTSPSGMLHVDQSSTTASVPVLYLDQADVSEEMIQFETTIGTGNAIEAVGAKTLTTTHFIKVTIPGGLTRYIPVGTIA